MPKQSEAQKIGSLGHSIVEAQVKKSGTWIARNLTEDFGIDMELEYAPSDVEGKFVKAQIKSHENVLIDGDFVKERLQKQYLRYVYECRVPIILIIVSTSTSKSWFIWLQKWILDSTNVSEIYNESKSKSLEISIHIKNELEIGLRNEIISIAAWENPTQLYIAINDLANLSLTLYDEKLSETLFTYLETFETENSVSRNYFDILVEKIIKRGASLWASNEGNKLAGFLYKFVHFNGDKLNAEQVEKVVTRGEAYSRTGLNALCIMYNRFPKHTASLNLPARFEKLPDPRLHYYCIVRERYLGIQSPAWIKESNNLTVGNLKFDFAALNGDLLNKWANRGDSVIFDYVHKMK